VRGKEKLEKWVSSTPYRDSDCTNKDSRFSEMLVKPFVPPQ
jgi:hypothetical protein